MTRRDIPPLSAIHTEITGTPAPVAWWVRWNVVPIVCCLCLWGFTFYAIGRLK
jgi:hypothetical protein